MKAYNLRCFNCRFSEPMWPPEEGEDGRDINYLCRYNPPRTRLQSEAYMHVQHFAEWPVVHGDGWCGKYETDV